VESGMKMIKACEPDIVFLDYYLNSVVKDAMDGLDVLVEIKKILPETDVVMLSGQDKIQVAVEVMKYGAFDYIVKGETEDEVLKNGIEHAKSHHNMKEEDITDEMKQKIKGIIHSD
jgi:DNA-binding NtrC family response regulator